MVLTIPTVHSHFLWHNGSRGRNNFVAFEITGAGSLRQLNYEVSILIASVALFSIDQP